MEIIVVERRREDTELAMLVVRFLDVLERVDDERSGDVVFAIDAVDV